MRQVDVHPVGVETDKPIQTESTMTDYARPGRLYRHEQARLCLSGWC